MQDEIMKVENMQPLKMRLAQLLKKAITAENRRIMAKIGQWTESKISKPLRDRLAFKSLVEKMPMVELISKTS
jgi:hypothetical protein